VEEEKRNKNEEVGGVMRSTIFIVTWDAGGRTSSNFATSKILN
jgi:hypothetical protein